MRLLVATPEVERPAREPDHALNDLLRLLARGDHSALADLYDRTSRPVYSLILRIVGDQATAEEVTIDVYSEIWRKSGQFQISRGSALTWIFLMARSRAIDFLRSSAGRRREREEPIDEKWQFADQAPDPEEHSLLSARRGQVCAALKALDADKYRAIHLAFFDGLTHQEIAARLGQPLGTIKTRIRTGMIELRELLGPREEWT